MLTSFNSNLYTSASSIIRGMTLTEIMYKISRFPSFRNTLLKSINYMENELLKRTKVCGVAR